MTTPTDPAVNRSTTTLQQALRTSFSDAIAGSSVLSCPVAAPVATNGAAARRSMPAEALAKGLRVAGKTNTVIHAALEIARRSASARALLRGAAKDLLGKSRFASVANIEAAARWTGYIGFGLTVADELLEDKAKARTRGGKVVSAGAVAGVDTLISMIPPPGVGLAIDVGLHVADMVLPKEYSPLSYVHQAAREVVALGEKLVTGEIPVRQAIVNAAKQIPNVAESLGDVGKKAWSDFKSLF